MSQILADTTLTLNTKSAIDLAGYPASNIGWIVFINASPYALRATVGSQVVPIPAWYYYPVFVDGRLTGSVSALPYLQTIPGTGFTKTLSVILYEKHEIPDNQSPQPLGGGPVDLTIASQLISTNQPTANVVIYAAPNGDNSATGALNINNAGQVILGDATNNGAITILGTTQNQISISLTGFLRMNDSSGNQRIDIEPGVFNLKDASLNNAVVVNTDSSPVIDVSAATGAVSLALKTGTLTRVSKFSGTASTTPTFFNHLLGAIPDLVIVTFNSTSATAHSFAVEYSSLTTTQAKITSDGSNPFVALAIKF